MNKPVHSDTEKIFITKHTQVYQMDITNAQNTDTSKKISI